MEAHDNNDTKRIEREKTTILKTLDRIATNKKIQEMIVKMIPSIESPARKAQLVRQKERSKSIGQGLSL